MSIRVASPDSRAATRSGHASEASRSAGSTAAERDMYSCGGLCGSCAVAGCTAGHNPSDRAHSTFGGSTTGSSVSLTSTGRPTMPTRACGPLPTLTRTFGSGCPQLRQGLRQPDGKASHLHTVPWHTSCCTRSGARPPREAGDGQSQPFRPCRGLLCEMADCARYSMKEESCCNRFAERQWQP